MVKKIFGVDKDELVKKIHQGIIAKNTSLESFFESAEFNRLFGIIATQESVDNDELAYKIQVIPGLSDKDFSQVCESVFHVLANQSRELKSEFYHTAIDYSGVRFHLLIGQGSCYWTERI